MIIAATADLHGYLPEIPECDILLIAGDVCPSSNHRRDFQANWLSGHFRPWLESLPAKEIVWTAGNHDFVLQDMNIKKRSALGGHYLDNEEIVIDGFKIWGSPMSPTFGNWAFMRDDAGLGEIWEKIPKDTDILMVHGPIYGYGDTVLWPMGRDPHVGSQTLRNRLTYTHFDNLRLFVCGHIHESQGGEWFIGGDNAFEVVNVSYVNENYEPVNPVMVFEL